MNALRRASYRWYGRYKALKAANIGRNQYVCAMCPPGTVHPKKAVQLDHVIPVVDPKTGWTNFDDFVDRLLVDTPGFQVLCILHHKEKTAKENEGRVEVRRKTKVKAAKKAKPKKVKKRR